MSFASDSNELKMADSDDELLATSCLTSNGVCKNILLQHFPDDMPWESFCRGPILTRKDSRKVGH